jgi:hypothetical protein
MKRWSSIATVGAAAALLCLSGCAAVEQDVASAQIVPDVRNAEVAVAVNAAAKKKKKPKDRFLGIHALRTANNGLGFVRLSWDLWSPLHYRGRVGLYDSKWADEANLSRMFLELDGRATDPLEFYGIGSQVIKGGLNIYAYAHTSGTPLGSNFFPGITEAEVEIETDADTMYFRARPLTSKSWTQLATHPFAAQDVPLLPSLGASNLSNGARVGFDWFNVLANGPAATEQTPAQILARQIWDAVKPQVDAYHDVDGAAPNYAAAQTDLAAAAGLLDTASATAQATDLGSIPKNLEVSAHLTQARAYVGQARSLANRSRQAPKILDALELAIENQARAVGVAYPANAPP